MGQHYVGLAQDGGPLVQLLRRRRVQDRPVPLRDHSLFLGKSYSITFQMIRNETKLWQISFRNLSESLELSGWAILQISTHIGGSMDTNPLPDKDVVDDGSSTEYNSKTNDDGGHNGRRLVEM